MNLTDSLFHCLNGHNSWLVQAIRQGPRSPMSGDGLSTQAVFCFPSCLIRELDWKWTSQNRISIYIGCKCQVTL